MRAAAFLLSAVLTCLPAFAASNQEALCTAAKSGTPEEIAALLKQGAKANGTCANTGSGTPLGSAMIVAKVDNMETLLKAGAKVNSKTDMRLGYVRNLASAELLLKHGAKVNGVDEYGKTPLMHLTSSLASNFPDFYQMTEQDAVDIAKLFIGKGAKIDFADKHGNTALIEVAFACLPKLTALLLENGAKIDARAFGQSALDRLRNVKDMHPAECGETEQVLLAHGAA